MRAKVDAARTWTIALGLAVVLLATVVAGARAEAPPEQSPTLVFVTKSDACECERNLCIAGEQEVVNFLAANPWGFRLEKMDLKETPKAAKELRVLTVPVVLLLDGQGRRVARFDGFFSWKDFQQAWETHLTGGEK